jgi:hypothetical protein
VGHPFGYCGEDLTNVHVIDQFVARIPAHIIPRIFKSENNLPACRSVAVS